MRDPLAPSGGPVALCISSDSDSKSKLAALPGACYMPGCGLGLVRVECEYVGNGGVGASQRVHIHKQKASGSVNASFHQPRNCITCNRPRAAAHWWVTLLTMAWFSAARGAVEQGVDLSVRPPLTSRLVKPHRPPGKHHTSRNLLATL